MRLHETWPTGQIRRFLPLFAALLLGGAAPALAQDEFGKHTYPETIEIADRLAGTQAPTVWESPLAGEAADLLEFLGKDRLLVGVVTADKNAAPKFGPVFLVDLPGGERRWEYDRGGRSTGSYSLLARDPLLVLLGAEADRAELVGLDPENGRRRWRVEVDAPYGVAPAGNRLLIAYRDGDRFEGRLLDPATGDPVIEFALPVEPFQGLGQIGVEVVGSTAWVIGRGIVPVDLASGRVGPTIPVQALDGRGPSSTLRAAGGLLAWSTERVALVDWAVGAVRWTARPDPGPVVAVADVGSGVVVVEGAETSNMSLLDPATGRMVWFQALDARVVSPVATAGELLLVTTDSSVIGLRAGDGGVAFNRPLPPAMAAASPTFAEFMGLPDVLEAEDGVVFVARERAGVAAFDLPTGSLRWYREPYHAGPALLQYTADGRLATMYATMMMMGQMSANEVVTPPPSLSAANRSGTTQLLAAAQRRSDEARRRYAAGREDASGLRLAAEAGMAATQLDIASGQFAAGMEFANSMVGLIGSLREWQRARGRQGAIDRTELAVQGALRAHQRPFRAGYYLRPFYYEGWGRGLMVVDTRTGLRRDFIFSPHNPPSLAYGLDLPTFALDSGSGRLVAFGISLRSERYDRRGIWGTHVPNFSALGYELDRLEFVDHPTYYPDPAIALVSAITTGDVAQIESVLQQGADPNAVAAGMGQPAIFLAATMGMAEAIELLVEAGANVNVLNDLGQTPIESPALPQNSYDALLAAGGRTASGEIPPRPAASVPPLWLAIAAGQTERVRALARQSEHLTWRNAHGETALFFAAAMGKPDLVRLLLEAGADVNATDAHGRTALDSAMNADVQAVLRAAGGRAGRNE